MSNSLRVAVVGAGHLGRIHARLLSGLNEVSLVAVVDPDEFARRQVADQHHVRSFDNHLHLEGMVEAAVVAAPTTDHFQIAMDLMERGIHVLVEKPLARTRFEAERLVRAAQAHRCVLHVGHIERFNPALRAVTGEIVEPKYIEARRASRFTLRSIDVGVVLDLMIHDIDLILHLVRSDVVHVSALGISIFGQHEDMAQARLEFRNGCVADLAASRTSLESVRRMNLYCPTAFVGVDFATPKAQLVKPRADVLDRSFDFQTLAAQDKVHLRDHLFTSFLKQETLHIPPGNALADELQAFLRSVRGQAPQGATAEEACQAVAVAELVLASLHNHGWDGAAAGPVGPFAVPGASNLRSAEWRPEQAKHRHRKAG